MVNTVSRFVFISLGFMALAVSGCRQYVKKSDYDAAISDLRANDQKQQQIDALEQEMQQKFASYDTRIAETGGRVRVDAIAHFAFNQATLPDEDKPLLDDFAWVMRSHYPDAPVTVEGFIDPAGSAGYNVRLGARRAEAVKDYLVGTGGLSADRVRTVVLWQGIPDPSPLAAPELLCAGGCARASRHKKTRRGESAGFGGSV